jgi:putative tryptophan/tyrosine transport system substrate-binding protein
MAIDIRRREFVVALGGVATWPLAARAQQSAMPVVGLLMEVPLIEPFRAAFRQGIAELGYVEGKNFAIEDRTKPESLPQAAADLIRLNVKVILAGAPAALAAASNATTSIPVVG